MKFFPISYEINQTSKLSSKMFPSTSNCSTNFICHCTCCPCHCLCCGCCCDCSCHMESLRQSKELNSNEKKLNSNYKLSKSSGNIFLKEDSRKINEDLENFNQELLALKMKLLNEKKKKDNNHNFNSCSTNYSINNSKFYYTPKLNKNNNNLDNNNNINYNNRQHSQNNKNFYDNLNNNNNTTIPRYKRISYNFNTNSNNNCNDCSSFNNEEIIKRPKKNYSHSKNFSSYDIINYSNINNNMKNNCNDNNNNNNKNKYLSNTNLISQIKEKTNNLINKIQNQTTRTLIKNASNFSKKTNYTSNNNSTLNIHKRNNFPFFNKNNNTNNNFNSIPINKNNRNKNYLNSLKDKINNNIYNYNPEDYNNNSNNFITYSEDYNNNNKNNNNNNNYDNKIQESSSFENSNKKNPYNYNYSNNNEEENPSFKIENNPNLNNNNFYSSSNSYSFPSKIDSFSIFIKNSPKIEDNSKDIVIQELKRKIKDLKNKLKNYTNPSSLASSQNDFNNNNNNNNFFNNNNNENEKIINAQQNEIEQLKNELEQMKQNNIELQNQIILYQKELQTVHNTMSNNSINNNVNNKLKNNFNDEELIIYPSCKLSILSSYKIINEKQEKYYSFNNSNNNINITKKRISNSTSHKKFSIKITNNNDINLIPMFNKNKKNINLSNELIYKIFTEAKNKNLLCYDLINKFFTLIDFNDFGDFNKNFLLSSNNENNNNENGSLYLTTNNNFYILTGKNFDKFYKFNPNKKSMDKLCSLNNNHCFGSLISYNNYNNIICLSGRFNKKVEIYNISKNIWKELPEMTIERSEFSSCVVNNKLLFACFGLNHPTNVYLDSIEYFDLDYYDNNNNIWRILKYKNDMNLDLKIKGNLAINYNNEKIIFLGGVNENKNIENFYQLIFNEDEFNYNNNNNENNKCYIEVIDRKFKDINKNKFYLFSNYNCFDYIDNKNYLYNCAFDTKNRLHLIQVSNMLHDIYEIEW